MSVAHHAPSVETLALHAGQPSPDPSPDPTTDIDTALAAAVAVDATRAVRSGPQHRESAA